MYFCMAQEKEAMTIICPLIYYQYYHNLVTRIENLGTSSKLITRNHTPIHVYTMSDLIFIAD